MPDIQHHICFISDQNIPELLGALLAERGSIHIHAIATAKMAAKAGDFEKTCIRHNIPCSIHPLKAASIEAVSALLDAILARYQDGQWAVNITGGTKLMTLAAFAWAARKKLPAFYIDTAERVIQFCSNGQWRKLLLPAILKFEPLLNLYGYEITNCARSQSGKSGAAHKLVDLIGQPKGMEALHFLNAAALGASASPRLCTEYKQTPELKNLLAVCMNAGKLDYTDSHITFRNESSRRWCHGIWMEEYVQAVLCQLQAQKILTSWAANVIIQGAGHANELDALFTANNRLHIIECKTSRLAGKGGATSILYKADSLNDRVGGIFTRSLLCSLDKLNEPEARRAETMGIRTVVGCELKNLNKIITEWIETP